MRAKAFLQTLTTIIICQLITFSAAAQTLTAQDLISKTDCMSMDCFTDYILAKGYSFKETRAGNEYTLCNYTLDGHRDKGNYIDYMIAANKSYRGINLLTTDKNYYLRLLNSFKACGFVITSSESTSDRMSTNYRSDKYPSIFVTLSLNSSNTGSRYWVSLVNTTQ